MATKQYCKASPEDGRVRVGAPDDERVGTRHWTRRTDFMHPDRGSGRGRLHGSATNERPLSDSVPAQDPQMNVLNVAGLLARFSVNTD